MDNVISKPNIVAHNFNHLVNYLKERENWNIEDVVTEDGIMELFCDDKNHSWVK